MSLRKEEKMDDIIKQLHAHILNGDLDETVATVQAALEQGLDPALVLNQGMIAAMQEVGRLFEEGEYFVPEMLIAARAMQAGLALLKPALKQADVKTTGKVLIGTVEGDLHDIGKNLVAMMLEGAGFEIKDLGINVPVGKMVDAVREEAPDILAMSALLTTTMVNMKAVIDALEKAGLREKVKVIVGGAPITDAYAAQIGADGYAQDASRAVTLAKSLVA